MKLQKRRRSAAAAGPSSGFTMVEAIVAIGVLGVLIISLYGALTSGFHAVAYGREDMRATQILVKKMDQIRLFNWEQITNGVDVPTTFFEAFNPESPAPTNNIAGGGPVGKGNGKGAGNAHGGQIIPLVYKGTLTIEPFPDDTPIYNSDMRQVTIQLDWESFSGLPRSRTLTTFVARYGMQNYVY